MGIYSRHATAFLILLVAFVTASQAQAAKLHPVPGIARALSAGPSGVMPSGLTVQRSQQLGVMLLKSQVNLSLGGGTLVPVTRGASLSVGGLARGAVTVLKNSSPPKIIGSAVIGGALALIPGASVRQGELILAGESGPADYDCTSGVPCYTASYWSDGTNCTRPDRLQAFECAAVRKGYSPVVSSEGTYSGGGGYFMYSPSCPSGRTGCAHFDLTAINSNRPQNCPQGTTYSPEHKTCRAPGAPVPFDQWDSLEGAIPSSDPSPADVQDFWFNLCGGDGSCMGSYTSDPSLSGPSSVQGPQSTTTSTGPDGTTTTTKDTQHDLDYSSPDGVVVRDRTTTTTTDPDGNTTTDTTVDTGPVVGANPDDDVDLDGSFTDTPFPEVEPFYEQKYPDGLEGVWSARKAEFEDSAFMDFLGSFVPSFSGSCPAWSINVNIASWANFGTHDFQSLCWVFDFIKVVLLVSAAFLCRALIFGG